jgi:hypothetical protein
MQKLQALEIEQQYRPPGQPDAAFLKATLQFRCPKASLVFLTSSRQGVLFVLDSICVATNASFRLCLHTGLLCSERHGAVFVNNIEVRSFAAPNLSQQQRSSFMLHVNTRHEFLRSAQAEIDGMQGRATDGSDTTSDSDRFFTFLEKGATQQKPCCQPCVDISFTSNLVRCCDFHRIDAWMVTATFQ